MNDWLLKKEIYSPRPDRDRFIDKSLLSILSVLSHVRQGDKRGAGVYYRLNPTLKFSFTLLLILFLSFSHRMPAILLLDSAVLLSLAFLTLKDIRKAAVITLAVVAFTAIIMLPSAFFGNVENSLKIVLKVAGTVSAVNILSLSTKWRHITKSLHTFHVPNIFILVLDLAVKYIVILGEFSLHMLYALKLRSVGKNDNKRSPLSAMIGNLFFKSKEMAEMTYSAMECRGFTGNFSVGTKRKLALPDGIFCLAQIGVFVLYFFVR